MKLKEFDYPLPKELIAQVPITKRDESRLMVVDRVRNDIELKKFKNVIEYLNKGDVFVINDTKVFPARLFGKKNTSGKVEILLVKMVSRRSDDAPVFTALYKSSKPLKEGQKLFFPSGLEAEAVDVSEGGRMKIRFDSKRDIYGVLDEIGVMPLPPYIKRDGRESAESDKVDYQTVYAENVGAVAAPTAGLHFTRELLERIDGKGVKIVKVTLHVGPGTFLPVREENVTDHKMHEEYFRLSDDCVKEVIRAKDDGKKVVAIGTTSLRALESAFDGNNELIRREGDTDLFIYPGYDFKVVDALITNFHLPASTLLMLVYAFGGTRLMRHAYDTAINERFRFYSYGDAMYIT